jgi:S1-C subfamily serine protease
MKLADLQRVHDYTTLANLFGVPASVLKHNLYKARGYTDFTIPKKSGGVRKISAPGRVRKRLQKTLLPVLSQSYKLGPHVHGFAENRSVRTNAEHHVSARVVVNLDLENFFGSISFQRVRGLFLAHPFNLHWNVANILAQICCLDGVLPAGAVTSPVITNIICAKLDKRLAALVGRLGGVYTRYADDLSLSFDRPVGQLGGIVVIDAEGNPVVGGAISEVITSEGFAINLTKFRVSAGASRKIVTGLVVNEKVNVKRSWYSALESQIYAVEKFGLARVAALAFPEERLGGVAERRLLRQLHGKVSYLRMVRGKGDWLAADIAHRLNRLHNALELRVPSVETINQRHRVARGVHIVHAANEPLMMFDAGQNQGTAFNTVSGLLVTAAHVVGDEDKAACEFIYVMNERSKKLIRCDLLAVDWNSDVAILRAQVDGLSVERSRFRVGDDPAGGDHLLAIGYPNYALGEHAAIVQCPVLRVFTGAGSKRASVGGFLQGGTSGGPVLNEKLQVCGFVHKGVAAEGGVAEIIAISEVIRVAVAAGLKL